MKRSISWSLLWLATTSQAAGLYVSGDFRASSEAVPLHSMMYGWSSAFDRGDHGYADLQREVGVMWQDWRLGWQQRRYYSLRFNHATAQFYRDLEQGRDHQGSGRLELEVEHFIADGLRLAWQGDWAGWHWQPTLTWYQVSHFQFGELHGNIRDGEASATIDYQFNDDKILDYQASVPNGHGVSLDLQLSRRWSQWHLQLDVQDAFNRLWLKDAAFTEGCINFGDTGTRACSSNGIASGRSGQQDVTKRIQSRYQARVGYTPWRLELQALQHDRYQQFGVEYQLPVGEGHLALAAYHDRQVKLGWQGDIGSQSLAVSVAADDIRPHFARQSHIQLDWAYHW
ncbi:hypothetical protein CHH28_15520 [Bacterioplanes sanyensis]|uniref:Uncharacterized protein n=1 Tax=Bacterioplanes sanyensis TaxID=1249553 RepID=A0A222FN58_9GAMM|nr:hypothetical protein [Bacterioplanes sanyensis]ASP39996.1 hypothetical protein CHH28_15520 [Bacterioplanes sanyensis]